MLRGFLVGAGVGAGFGIVRVLEATLSSLIYHVGADRSVAKAQEKIAKNYQEALKKFAKETGSGDSPPPGKGSYL